MIIPGINCRTYGEAASQAKKISEFSEWAHLDVEDGIFVSNTTWGDPVEFKELVGEETALKALNFEIHLMVEEPEKILESWFGAGARRVIVHIEAMSNPHFVLELLKQRKEVFLGINLGTKIETLLPYLNPPAGGFPGFHLLAVPLGPAGQKFNEEVLAKIKFLRERAPDAIIEVDGGIDPTTAKLAREAGATNLISVSYIMSSPNPRSAFEALSRS